MPAIVFWAIMIYEAIFVIRLIRVTKTYREQQTEDAKKSSGSRDAFSDSRRCGADYDSDDFLI